MTWRRMACISLVIIWVWMLLPGIAVAEGPLPQASNTDDVLRLLFYLLAWLLPLGITLVAVGQSEPAHMQQAATALPLALVIALAGYYLCGFALQFGGIGLVTQETGLATLVTEWAPLEAHLGPGWGLLGLQGFALRSIPEQAMSLFLAQLALVTTATLIPLLTLKGQIPRLPHLLLALLVACAAYPLAGNWVQGGGWLMHLGTTRGLGGGFVDYGLGIPHLVGGLAALAGLAAFRQRGQRIPPASVPELPPSTLPLNTLTGAFLALVGWLAVIVANPLTPLPPSPTWLILKALLAVASSVVGTFFYGWLVRGRPDVGLTGRGILAALVAVGPGLPFVPAEAAALIGGGCGILLAPAMYLVERVLHLADRSAVISVHALAALWGLVAVGLFAAGPQGLAANASNPLPGIGYLAAGRLHHPQQLYAQLIGVAAILVLAGWLPWLVMTLVAQAYAPSPSVRARAQARALQAQGAREMRERRKRQGLYQDLRPRLYAAYLAVVAAPFLRPHRRILRLRPGRQTPLGVVKRRRLQRLP